MKDWQRRVLGVLALGGGATGLSYMASAALLGQALAASEYLLVAVAGAFFLWGVWCGLQMIEGRPRANFTNAIFWLAQVPLFQTPAVVYSAICGAHLQLFVKLSPVELGFTWGILGSQVRLGFGQAGQPPVVGLNALALMIACFLFRTSAVSTSSANAPAWSENHAS